MKWPPKRTIRVIALQTGVVNFQLHSELFNPALISVSHTSKPHVQQMCTFLSGVFLLTTRICPHDLHWWVWGVGYSIYVSCCNCFSGWISATACRSWSQCSCLSCLMMSFLSWEMVLCWLWVPSYCVTCDRWAYVRSATTSVHPKDAKTFTSSRDSMDRFCSIAALSWS